MYKLFSLLAMILLSMGASAQRKYTVSKDPENGAQVFKGIISFEDLAGEESFGWFGKGEAAYKPDAAALKYLAEKLPQFRIVAVMGTWCEDSQHLVPKLARTLKEALFPMENLSLYGVDRSKQLPEADPFKIQLVPTIIVLKGEQEIGRITETVKESIEKDLARIIRESKA